MLTLSTKLQKLNKWFKQQGCVVVAYSGGVDSALLLYIGTQVLGTPHCHGLFADSCLVSKGAKSSCLAFAEKYKLSVHQVSLEPLGFPFFVQNQEDRCYICKKNIYTAFFKSIESGAILVDGTNCDDLAQHRPGFQALTELGVATPFLDCQITKFDVRSMSYHLGLSSWAKLSESCLATRVERDSMIDKETLIRIDQLEQDLHFLGLTGCRVMPRKHDLLLTVHTGQFEQIFASNMAQSIYDIAGRYGFAKVFLDLFEREGILPSLLEYIGFEGKVAPKKQFLDYFNNMSGIW